MSPAYLWAGVAQIWLGPFASYNTVIGGSTKTNVFDQGTNNTLVGVNNMRGNSPGPTLHEAQERRRTLFP